MYFGKAILKDAVFSPYPISYVDFAPQSKHFPKMPPLSYYCVALYTDPIFCIDFAQCDRDRHRRVTLFYFQKWRREALVVWGMHEEDAICDFFKAAAHLIFVSFFSVESSR